MGYNQLAKTQEIPHKQTLFQANNTEHATCINDMLSWLGFITMTPQLFINYKLKSVAHLPWRMLTYKTLNTFIDDMFAFVIKMPTMYRIGCFRDGVSFIDWYDCFHNELYFLFPDIVFFIYLYQRWIYRVDMTRVNEFGSSGKYCLGVRRMWYRV